MTYTTTISLGNIMMSLSVLIAAASVQRLLLRPCLMLLEEHNLLWEEYSKRHGMSYRVPRGRGFSRGYGSGSENRVDLSAACEFAYSAEGLAMTKSFEGCILAAYQDAGGVWTIGYGHTGPEVHEGLVWTQEEAEAAIVDDCDVAAACVNAAVTAPIVQCQFDALTDFCFNCGRENLLESTLLKMLNRSEFIAAEAQFGLWVYVGDEVADGLVRRRAAEARMFGGQAWECFEAGSKSAPAKTEQL